MPVLPPNLAALSPDRDRPAAWLAYSPIVPGSTIREVRTRHSRPRAKLVVRNNRSVLVMAERTSRLMIPGTMRIGSPAAMSSFALVVA
eukprot:2895198-Rhodomonas_salina.2